MGQGIGLGIAIVALNGLGAWFLLRWGWRQRPAVFIRVFFGGMVGRLLLVGVASFSVLAFTQVHRLGFAAGLLGAYFLFLVAEVLFVRHQLRRQRPGLGQEKQPALGSKGQ